MSESPEELPPVYETIEEQCWDSIVASRKLFNSKSLVGAPEFYESLKLKLNTKISHEYANVAKSEDLAQQVESDLKNLQIDNSNAKPPQKKS